MDHYLELAEKYDKYDYELRIEHSYYVSPFKPHKALLLLQEAKSIM